MSDAFQGLTTNIVAAYVRNNTVAASDLSRLILSVYTALISLGKAPAETAPAAELKPAVPIRRSVTPDTITCLDCGAKLKMLRRHLVAEHDTTSEAYRTKWGLPHDYPLVAPNYARQRSELALKAGLGKQASGRPREKK